VIAILTILCSIGLATWLIWGDYEATRAATARRLGNLANVLEKDIARNIEIDRMSLEQTKGALRLPDLDSAPPELRRAALFSRVATAKYLDRLVIIDEHGAFAGSSEGVEPRTLDFSDREYFQALRDDDSGGLYVSRPVRSQVSGTDNLALGLRLSHPDGSFAGVVAAGIRLDYFTDLFAPLNLGPGGSVTLVRTDGIVLAKWPNPEQSLGLDISATDVFKAMMQSRAGVVDGTSLKGVGRTYSFRRLDGLPLILTVAFATSDTYAEWRRRSVITLAAFAALLGLAALLGSGLLRELSRRIQAELDAREAAAKLAAALDRVEAVFQHSDDALYAASPRADGQFAYETVNPKVEECYGKPASELLGRTPEECLPAEAAETVAAAWAQCIREGRPLKYTKSFTFDAERRHWESVVVPMRDQNGTVCRLILAVRDDTERQRMEQELVRLNEDLEQRVGIIIAEREAVLERASSAERMQTLGQLAGGIAHDFNNVLQAVSGCAALIERRSDDPATARRLARHISEATVRGAAITRRLLAFARRDELRAESVSIRELFEGLQEILVHTLGGSITVHAVVADEGLAALVDKGQLETVLLNLATNARDAMPSGGTLTFRAAAETVEHGNATGGASLTFRAAAETVEAGHASGLAAGQYVRLAVVDTGMGMDLATLARATEPFFTTKPVGKGTGLGLSMAKGFAEQSHGALAIASSPGGGTTVTLWLPKTDLCLTPPDETRTGFPQSMGARSAHVLVVDDDPMVREAIAEALDDEYCVATAASGAEALSVLDRDEDIDVLVTDLTMPGMDGLSLIREAQSRCPGLPALLLTGFAGDVAQLAVSGVTSGTFSLLRKPTTAAQLSERIAALLASRNEAGPMRRTTITGAAEPPVDVSQE
jgi:PAS domain S-box-containing protein